MTISSSKMKSFIVLLAFSGVVMCNHDMKEYGNDEGNLEAIRYANDEGNLEVTSYANNKDEKKDLSEIEDEAQGDSVRQNEPRRNSRYGRRPYGRRYNKPCLLNNKHKYDSCGRKCSVFRGRLVNCCRVRKDFESMSKAEQLRFIRAYKIVSTSIHYRKTYVKLITMHEKYFATRIHRKEEFFPWHRWFNLQIENLMRKVDCRVTLPYWDWSIWSHDPWNRKRIWGQIFGLGGNGRKSDECVTDGAFSVGKWKTATGACLKRSFNGKPPDADQIAIAIKEPSFSKFETMVRVNIHEGMHCFINGTMCTGKSAEAPEFFLHHGFIDKIWADYQKKGSYHKNAYYPSIKKKMVGINYYPIDLIDLNNQPGRVRVCYEDPTVHAAKKIRDFLGRLSLKQLEDLERLSFSKTPGSAKALFHLSAAERKFAAALEKDSMKHVDNKRRGSIFARSLSSLERVEGFRIPDYCRS